MKKKFDKLERLVSGLRADIKDLRKELREVRKREMLLGRSLLKLLKENKKKKK